MRYKLNCLDYTIYTGGWDIDGVAYIVLRGWYQIPPFHPMLCQRASFGRSLKNEHSCSRGCQGGAVKIKVPVEV